MVHQYVLKFGENWIRIFCSWLYTSILNFAICPLSPIYCLLLDPVLPFPVTFMSIFPLLMSFYVDLLITVNPLTPLSISIPPVLTHSVLRMFRKACQRDTT